MMTLEWSREIPPTGMSPASYEGFFWQYKGQACLFYDVSGHLAMLTRNVEQPRLFCPLPPSRRAYIMPGAVSLPMDWRLLEQHEPSLLVLSTTSAFDLSAMKPVSPIPDEAAQEYRLLLRSPDQKDVLLDDPDYRIIRKGQWGYACESAGKVIWEFRGQGWLYTDFVRIRDRVCFGTAGQGGYFYMLELATGKALARIKTGGTMAFILRDGYAYFTSNGSQASLLCMNLQTGEVVQRIALPGQTGERSLQLVGDQLHTVTSRYTRQRLFLGASWSCISI